MYRATAGKIESFLEINDHEIIFNSNAICAMADLKKIEIVNSQIAFYFGSQTTTLEMNDTVENVITKLKSMPFLTIAKGESLIFLPQEKNQFPSKLDIATGAPMDVEDLGWNVLERFSHVTRFAKDLIKKDKTVNRNHDYEIVSKFSIDSLKFKQELEEFIFINKDNTRISESEINLLMDQNGVFKICEKDWKEMVFKRGLEDNVRSFGFMILLKVYNKWNSSLEEREDILEKKKSSYHDLKQHWQELLNAEIDSLDALDSINAAKMNEMKHGILKDILRTDRDHEFYHMESAISPSNIIADSSNFHELGRGLQLLYYILMTYAMYNLDLGYVQGMNDLLSPILMTVDSEEVGFWCFVGFMDRMQKNFSKDQLGIKTQLHHLSLLIKFMDPILYKHLEFNDCHNMFICYRWILVCFKREFSLPDLISLWERIWASGQAHFGIFVAFAMLNVNRAALLMNDGFDDLLRYVNDSSLHYDVNDIIWRSQFLHEKFKDLIQMIPNSLRCNDFPISQRNYDMNEIIETNCSSEELTILIDLMH